MRLALPQAGSVPLKASPDAPDKDLKAGTWTRAYCLAMVFLAQAGAGFNGKLFTAYSPVAAIQTLGEGGVNARKRG